MTFVKACAVLLLTSVMIGAQSQQVSQAPHLATEDGRHALIVDGKPFVILGAQINNSNSWPAVLPHVWPTLERMHVNTVEAPVYREQLEPTPGHFDFSTIDLLLAGARVHHLHLIVLWFGTYNNGNMHYAPEWVKTHPERYPRVINAKGDPIDVLSANSRTNLEADKSAFIAMMWHLAQADGDQHTTLMVQVENESASWARRATFLLPVSVSFAARCQATCYVVCTSNREPGKVSSAGRRMKRSRRITKRVT